METPKFSIPKLAPLCSDKSEDLLNNVKSVDEMGEFLLKSTTFNRIGCFIRNIQRQYIRGRLGVKNAITLSLKANKSTVDQIEGPNNGVLKKNHAEEVENHKENGADLHENAF